MSFSDTATGILNRAKLVKDISSKIGYLEQIKEIIFHRDKSLVSAFVPEIIDLMVEKSVTLRKFLVSFAAEAIKIDDSVSGDAISLFSYILNDDQEGVIRAVAMELSKFYDVMYVAVSLSRRRQSKRVDPKESLNALKSVVSHIFSILSAKTNETVRFQCLKLVESVLLFEFPNIDNKISGYTITFDKFVRKQRFNITDIPLHHSFIDRNSVEAGAKSMLSKLLLWIRRNGPKEFPFSPRLLLQLAKTLTRLSIDRPETFSTISTALPFYFETQLSLAKSSNINQAMKSGTNADATEHLTILSAMLSDILQSPHVLQKRSESDVNTLKLSDIHRNIEDYSRTSASTAPSLRDTSGVDLEAIESTVLLLVEDATADDAEMEDEELLPSAAKRPRLSSDGLERLSSKEAGGAGGVERRVSGDSHEPQFELCSEVASAFEQREGPELFGAEPSYGDSAVLVLGRVLLNLRATRSGLESTGIKVRAGGGREGTIASAAVRS